MTAPQGPMGINAIRSGGPSSIRPSPAPQARGRNVRRRIRDAGVRRHHLPVAITWVRQIKAAGMGYQSTTTTAFFGPTPASGSKPSALNQRQYRRPAHSLRAPRSTHSRRSGRSSRERSRTWCRSETRSRRVLLTRRERRSGPISNWAQLAQLLGAGIASRGRQVDPTIKIMIHLDQRRGPDEQRQTPSKTP